MVDVFISKWTGETWEPMIGAIRRRFWTQHLGSCQLLLSTEGYRVRIKNKLIYFKCFQYAFVKIKIYMFLQFGLYYLEGRDISSFMYELNKISYYLWIQEDYCCRYSCIQTKENSLFWSRCLIRHTSISNSLTY